MKLTFTNKTATIKYGKRIAFATIELHIEGEDYPIRLTVTADTEYHTRSDRAKLNNKLKALGFKIGEVLKDENVPETSYTLIH